MLRSSLSTVALAAALAVICNAGAADARRGARAVSRGGEFSFRLESGGRVLPTYHHKGYTYVEGQRGDRYSIRVFNHTAERVEAAVTVDGRDVITGRQGNFRTQRGYVIQPYGSVLIDGFRTSWSGVAAFRFTDIVDSYAARMGNASNVGVIGVAVFKEKKWRPRPPPPIARSKKSRLGSGYGRGGAPASEAESAPSYDSADSLAGGGYAQPRESSRGIGTGYGEDQYSPASETQFTRRNHSSPDARLAIYYDDHEGLIARGVIPRPYYPPPRPPEPQPFPYSNDYGFAPPPPPYHWE